MRVQRVAESPSARRRQPGRASPGCFYEGRSFRKADVAASSGYDASPGPGRATRDVRWRSPCRASSMRDGLSARPTWRPPPGTTPLLVRAELLVMSGGGARAELLSALSMDRASGPVHEGTSCFYEGRSFRKADVAASSGYDASPGPGRATRDVRWRSPCRASSMRDGLSARPTWRPPPGTTPLLVRAELLVMSGGGARAELLSALSMDRASGPVHEGTSCFQGALPAMRRPRWDKQPVAVARVRHHVQGFVRARILPSCSPLPAACYAAFYEGRSFRKADVAASSGYDASPGPGRATRDVRWRSPCRASIRTLDGPRVGSGA